MNQIIDLIIDDLDDVLKKHLTDIVLSSATILGENYCILDLGDI